MGVTLPRYNRSALTFEIEPTLMNFSKAYLYGT